MLGWRKPQVCQPELTMKLEDFRSEVPRELSELAEQFQVEKCWIFPDKVWQVIVEMRGTAWRKMWGMQYK
jgi:intein-encoded DNA endonuclease-like protein